MSQIQIVARLVLIGVGVCTVGIAGCTQTQTPETTSAQPTDTVQANSSPNSAQASPTTEAPTRSPDVVYVPTPQEAVDEMLRLAKVQSTDRVYDLGSGDGRIVITAAKQYGARGTGIDIDPERIKEANANAQKAGVTNLVDFRQEDLFKSDFKDATVVTLYLLPRLNVQLRPKLLRELKPGTRIVSHQFDMGEWKPEKVVKVGDRTIYYWTIPENPPANLLK
ncbi:MAG: class I SAM-dependent methyltransferase [Leptolyngbyaceae cyanobacterium bins.349]|nr:class I SAM-dependent methyltransferase [Leptolyngbyaceae cyanobacterium bins.349]